MEQLQILPALGLEVSFQICHHYLWQHGISVIIDLSTGLLEMMSAICGVDLQMKTSQM